MVKSPPVKEFRETNSEEVEGNLIGGMNPARLKVTSKAGNDLTLIS